MKVPEQALSREAIYEAPPSIMVTNTTMLEYMLIRRKDAPIIEKSQGILKYIVLDEAHSYIGSQAAELALLLRRVMQAFNVGLAQINLCRLSRPLPLLVKTLLKVIRSLLNLSLILRALQNVMSKWFAAIDKYRGYRSR